MSRSHVFRKITLGMLLIASAALADDPEKEKSDAAVLRFDADVIEGQKKSPELFLQTESQSVGIEAIVFIREDFNDFHRLDGAKRPTSPTWKAPKRGGSSR